jgi:hypothetical protein
MRAVLRLAVAQHKGKAQAYSSSKRTLGCNAARTTRRRGLVFCGPRSLVVVGGAGALLLAASARGDTGGCACRVASSSSKLGSLRPKGSWFATGHKACSALLCVWWWALTAVRPLLFTRQAKGS